MSHASHRCWGCRRRTSINRSDLATRDPLWRITEFGILKRQSNAGFPQRRRSLVGGNRPDGESSSGTSCFGAGGNKHLRLDRDLRYVLPHATTLPAILKTIVDPLRDPRVGDEKQSPRRPRFATLEIESGSISSRNDSATFQSTSHSGQ